MKRVVIIAFILMNGLLLNAQSVGFQTSYNLTNLDTFSSGVGLELYSDFSLNDKWSIIPCIGYNALQYTNSSVLHGDQYLLQSINQQQATFWFNFGLAGVYNILEKKHLKINVGPEANYILFPKVKSYLSGETIFEPESRMSANFLVNLKMSNLFNTNFDIDVKTNVGYFTKSKVDYGNFVFSRPWSDFIQTKLQVAIFYNFGGS